METVLDVVRLGAIMTYAEKLLDPRWRTKRLEILERDNWECKRCGDDRRLQVHHLRYLPFSDPWSYQDEDLITICDSCHAAINVSVPLEEIRNPWITYSRMKKGMSDGLSAKEYTAKILELSNGLSL